MTVRADHLVVLTAGGTGGHVFPAEALATELKSRGCSVSLITDRRGGAYGGALGAIDTHRVRAGGMAGKTFTARLRSAPELAIGTWQARAIIKKLRPDAVVGFGGYASVPTMLAAIFGGYNTVIHEQNAVLGRANRLLASRVQRIATSFEDVRGIPEGASGRIVHTGMPVRPAVIAKRSVPYPPLQGDGDIRILVLGGSQGARVLSEVVPEALARLDGALMKRLVVTQQCRAEDLQMVGSAYQRHDVRAELASFFDDVPELLAASHLVIGRAGASSVAETMVIGRPAILVPYPHAIDDHQAYNAQGLDDAGGGWVMSQDSFTPEALAIRLSSLLSVPQLLTKAAACAHAAGHPDAAQRLADVVFEMLAGNGERRAA